MGGSQNDVMISRLESELEERNSFIQTMISQANDAGRDLNDSERENIARAKDRVSSVNSQIQDLVDTRDITMQARQRASDLQRTLSRQRSEIDGTVPEYRSAGAYLLDNYKASLNDRDAKDRLELFERTAAHQKTSDNLGIIPDPVIGGVINFVDAARPLVSFLGPRAMPSAMCFSMPAWA